MYIRLQHMLFSLPFQRKQIHKEDKITQEGHLALIRSPESIEIFEQLWKSLMPETSTPSFIKFDQVG